MKNWQWIRNKPSKMVVWSIKASVQLSFLSWLKNETCMNNLTVILFTFLIWIKKSLLTVCIHYTSHFYHEVTYRQIYTKLVPVIFYDVGAGELGEAALGILMGLHNWLNDDFLVLEVCLVVYYLYMKFVINILFGSWFGCSI